jgi:hypothetical protein
MEETSEAAKAGQHFSDTSDKSTNGKIDVPGLAVAYDLAATAGAKRARVWDVSDLQTLSLSRRSALRSRLIFLATSAVSSCTSSRAPMYPSLLRSDPTRVAPFLHVPTHALRNGPRGAEGSDGGLHLVDEVTVRAALF